METKKLIVFSKWKVKFQLNLDFTLLYFYYEHFLRAIIMTNLSEKFEVNSYEHLGTVFIKRWFYFL